MKKLVLTIALVFISAFSFLNAQVIEDFESIPLNIMFGNTAVDFSTMTVIPNPYPGGMNTSDMVVEFKRDKDGVPWGGFWSLLPAPVDISTNKYVHVKVWKPRISPIRFKIEKPSENHEILSMNTQTLINQWEDIVFDFSAYSGEWTIVAFMPDYEDPLTLTEDIFIYFDDIVVNNDPTPASASVYTIDSFEYITMNIMLGGADDFSTMTIVDNPDPAGINASAKVIEYLRDKDGVPWGGFWSALPGPIDLTINKYVHVKVWKPRISPIRFKIENPGENHEILSMNTQTLINQWEDIVFDFSEFTGEWIIIAFMPDFEDPMTLTDDITMYFDDIRVNDDPNPVDEINVTFTVDMTNADPFNPTTDDVYIASDFTGWNMPGTNPDLKMTPGIENPMIYTLTYQLNEPKTIAYKYFRVINNIPAWDYGEWAGDPNRMVIITGETTLEDTWADMPVIVTFNVDMTNADPFDPTHDDVYITGSLANDWSQPGTISGYKLTPNPENQWIYTIILLLYPGDYQYKYFRIIDGVPSWDNAEWTGDPNRTITVVTAMTVDNIWGEITTDIVKNSSVSFSIYPNPVEDFMKIDNINGADRIEIYNVTGHQLHSLVNITEPSVSISTSGLKKGVYFVSIYTAGEVQTAKFIK